MSPYSSEEIVTRNFLLKEKPKAIINIVDATNIERNLYLTMQLLELNMPMVVALNMMDEMSGNGGTVLINELEAHLGVPVVPISAAKGEGIDELVSHVLHVAYYQENLNFYNILIIKLLIVVLMQLNILLKIMQKKQEFLYVLQQVNLQKMILFY